MKGNKNEENKSLLVISFEVTLLINQQEKMDLRQLAA